MVASTLKRFLPFALGIALLVFLFSQTKTDILKELKNANLFLLGITIVAILINLLFRGAKWNRIVAFFGHKISWVRATQIFCMGTMVGFFTPLKIGIFVRALYLKPLKTTKAVASILIDRLSDILLVAIIGSSVLAVLLLNATIPPNDSNAPAITFMVLGFVVLALLGILTQSQTVFRFFEPVLKRLLPFSALQIKIKEVFAEIGQFDQNKKRLVEIFGFGLLSFATAATYYFFTAKALGIETDFFLFAGMVALTLLIETVPITALGIGTREGAWVIAAPFLKIGQNQALILPLLATLLNYVTLSAVGLTLSFSEQKTNKKI